MILALILAVAAFFAGWFSAPLSLLLQSGDCAAESLFVYDEPQRIVTSQARWYSHRASGQFYYQATLSVTPDNQPAEKVLSHRTVVTDWSIHSDSLSLHTARTFRVAGPETTDARWGRYIDPMAEAGYSNRVYVFKLPGGRMAAGHRNIPLSTCLTKK